MTKDLNDILGEWEYDPDNNIRILLVNEGRSVLQVRLPLGMEQYEMDGRPDGKHPFEMESVLDHMEALLALWVDSKGTDSGFQLDHQDFIKLQNEGILYYYRYMLLFQLDDYSRVVRDTNHNLRLCKLLDTYCSNEDEKLSVLQFRPHIIRMNAIAQSMLMTNADDISGSVHVLNSAIEQIEGLEMLPSPVFQFERARSVSYLRTSLDELSKKGNDPRIALETELSKALEEENYEHAAELRDQIRILIDKAQSA